MKISAVGRKAPQHHHAWCLSGGSGVEMQCESCLSTAWAVYQTVQMCTAGKNTTHVFFLGDPPTPVFFAVFSGFSVWMNSESVFSSGVLALPATTCQSGARLEQKTSPDKKNWVITTEKKQFSKSGTWKPISYWGVGNAAPQFSPGTFGARF